MALEGTSPPSDVNVPGDYFSLAGFEVTTYGRFWVTPEDYRDKLKTLLTGSRCSEIETPDECLVVTLKNDIKAIRLYRFHSERESYLVFAAGYLIEFSIDLFGICSDQFTNAAAINSCITTLKHNNPPRTDQLKEIEGFENMVETIGISYPKT